jgi:curved DNA-binding protein CbpA
VALSPSPLPSSPAKELEELRARAAKLKGQNHFDVLGITQNADGSAVKLTYFKLAKVYHPDTVAPDAPPEISKLKAEIFSAVGEAYRVLNDDKSRANYLDEVKHGGGEKVDVAKLLAAEDLFHRAMLLINARRFPEGLKLLEEAITNNPDEGEFYAWRGYAKYFVLTDKAQAKREATEDLQKALKKNERCAPAQYFLGQIAKLSGDAAAALKHFKKTVELAPEHIDAQREIRLMAKK